VVSIWDRVPPLDETIDKIDAVTADQVRGFAERLIGSTPALALYGPVGRAPTLDRLLQRLAA
jgi:hypothetical protein